MALCLIQRKDQSIAVTQQQDIETVDHVPGNIYRFVVTETMDGIRYDLNYVAKKFTVPEQRYGDHQAQVDIVVNDYDRMNPSFGAMMLGLKGSGKTILCYDICNRLLAHGLPVISIESSIKVEHLRNIMKVAGPCVVLFDEFGKYYREDDDREELLSLFSDPQYVGYLYLITGNSGTEVSDFLLNRPGRFRYRFSMDQVPSKALHDFFRQYQIDPIKLTWLVGFRERLSYDVLLAIRPALQRSATFMEFRDAVKWMNVPTPSTSVISIRGPQMYVKEDGTTEICTDISGEISDGNIILHYTTESGITGTESFPLMNSSGRMSFVDSTQFAQGPLLLTLDICGARLADSMLAPMTPFSRRITGMGLTPTVPSNIEGTDIPTEDCVRLYPRSNGASANGFLEAMTVVVNQMDRRDRSASTGNG